MSLIPELSVCDYAVSLRFYTQVLGWQIAHARPEEGFAMLTLGTARLMIDALGRGRDFDASLTARDRPFGRGLNLAITVPAIAPLLHSLSAAGHPLYLPPEDRWYRAGHVQIGQRQFVVADPDGYLLRFVESLGDRPAGDAHAL